MKKKIVLLTLVSVFLLSATAMTSVAAQPRIVGVNVGDWFKYGDLAVDWSSNDPNATFPPSGWEWLETMNETEWMLLSVEGISGTNITFEATEHLKNGSDRIRDGWVDIDSGNCSKETAETMAMGMFAISADLNVNDSIYTRPDYSTMKINETVVRTYPDSTRDTNHLNITMEYSDIEVYMYYSMSFYWDKPTGIVVEMSSQAINRTGEYLTTWSQFAIITDSNVWVVPEFPTWTSLLLILTVLTVAIAIYKRRLLKTPIH